VCLTGTRSATNCFTFEKFPPPPPLLYLTMSVRYLGFEKISPYFKVVLGLDRTNVRIHLNTHFNEFFTVETHQFGQ